MNSLSYFVGAILFVVVAILAFTVGLILPDGWRIATTVVAIIAVAAAGGLIGIGVKAGRSA